MKTIPFFLIALSSISIAAESPIPGTSPQGLASSDWSSIRAAYEAGRHAVQRQENGTLTARNPGQQWRTEFDGKGFTVTPDHGQWTWGIELTGYGDRAQMPAATSVNHEGGKITSQRDACLTEWFINDTRGLEQGWTLQQRPILADHSAPLILHLSTRGDLRPQVSPDQSSVSFQQEIGGSALTYGGLKAWDADGKNLVVRFEPAGETAIRIAVEEQNARYPITIDPIAQQAYLKPAAVGTTQEEDGFGSSVAISGDTVVVGAPNEDSSTTGVNTTPDENAFNSGAAYVFTRSGTTWTQQAYLKPAAVGTTQVGDSFGYSVAIAGETIVVGAYGESSSTTGVNTTPNESASGAGAAYVFTRSGTTWSQQAYLKPAAVGTTQAGDFFGTSVGVSGDTVVVGSNREDSSTLGVNTTPNESSTTAGAAYVFTRSGTTWSQQAYIKPAAVGTTQANDGFGRSVSVSGNTMVVGAFAEDSSTTGVNGAPNETALDAGAAYVFVRSGSAWTQQAYLKPAAVGTTQALDEFGLSVAVSGDTVVVGARFEDSSSTGVNSTPNDSTGAAGAAYVFTRSGTTWSQQAYLKPAAVGTTQLADYFGWSVAIAGETIVVGAYGENSYSLGVNSTPNEDGNTPGAAYVFNRSGTIWSQQAYLKPMATGTTQEGDYFGWSVAVSGETVLVGAQGEASSTTGVNTSPNEIAAGAGAAYVFNLNAPAPTVAITAVSPDPRTAPVTTMTITFSTPVQNFDLSDLTLTRDNGPNLINGNFSLATANNTLFTLAVPAAATTPGGTYRLSVLVSNIVDLGGIPLGFGGEEQWLTLPANQDTDNDGMNDAAEFNMAALGFNWQVSQPALVATYYDNANSVGYYSLSQVQALHSGTPLIQRNPATGKIKLTMDWKKSTNLTNFLDFPAPAGSAVTITPQGDVEFEFPSTDNAAFFRIEVD